MAQVNTTSTLIGIGDGINDFLALLTVDYGIIMGQLANNSKLVQLCHLGNIRLEPISKLNLATKRDRTIFIAENWECIIEALEALNVNCNERISIKEF